MARLLGVSLLVAGLGCALLVAPSESAADDVSALLAFKKAIFEDPLAKLSDWNSKDENPCGWTGVGCSPFDSRVVTLELANSSLKGFLALEIESLSSLQKLILDHNTLMGPIPKGIGKLRNLIMLNLSTNQLDGPIPIEIGDMPKISKIDLRANRLDGAIPPEIGNLTSLTELQLSNNSLTGTIPGSNDSSMVSTNRDGQIGLCRLTQLTDMDLSYNYLAGDVPTCFMQIRRLSLVGNCFENNDTTNRPDNQCENSQKGNESSRVDGNQQKSFQQPLWLLILEVITAISLLTVLTLCTIAGLRRCKARSSRNSGTWTRAISWKENTVISIDDDLLANVPKISRQELAEACEDFSNIIGSTHDTVVYKGTMKDGSEIAVVSLSASVHYWTSYVELYFQKEARRTLHLVVEMARLSHENVAKMVGYSKESDPFSRMLVFQYPPNGTLYEHLHDGEGYQLSWPRRMKIALSIARALRYLHTEMQPPFAVAALTSSSVYLTEDFSPKIIDFERWRALLTKPGLSSGSIVNGSFNNIIDSRHRRFMDIQANTFAFGVILLELISGRAPVSKDTGDLVDWARKHLDQTEEFIKLVDPKLMNANHENLGIVCNVVNLCIDAEPCRRPSMNMITAILEEGIDTSPATVLRDSSLAWAEAEIAIS
uniref:OSIGBa0159I10.8 protein n=1 Tax=Oryza sativa TaxID=4530 RepID=Q01IH7_ORYSA|nr:OSIGBa0159I10.8 [Oryza sativa]